MSAFYSSARSGAPSSACSSAPTRWATVRHEMGSPSSAPSSAHLVRPCTRLKGLPDEVARPDLKEPEGLHLCTVHGLEAIVNQYLDAFFFNEGL